MFSRKIKKLKLYMKWIIKDPSLENLRPICKFNIFSLFINLKFNEQNWCTSIKFKFICLVTFLEILRGSYEDLE